MMKSISNKVAESENGTGQGKIILELLNAGRRERGTDNWLLRNIDLTIHDGDRIAVIGPTGSGKTVLLRILSLLDPLDAGELLWRGEQIQNDEIPLFRKEVVYIHQQPVLFEGTVISNLEIPFKFKHNREFEFNRKDISGMLDEVGFSERFLARSQRDLSGGERQIVAILRAIQLNPTVLLLDEPTAALDHDTTLAVETLVNKWQTNESSPRATVWVSHSTDQVERISDAKFRMDNGSISRIT